MRRTVGVAALGATRGQRWRVAQQARAWLSGPARGSAGPRVAQRGTRMSSLVFGLPSGPAELTDT